MKSSLKTDPRTVHGSADYTLLVRQLEAAVLKDNENLKCRRVLEKRQIWEQLTPEQAMAWAGIAQIAGCMDTALDIYKDLAGKHPGSEPAWKARIELLDILDRKEALAAAVQQAGMNLGKDRVLSWIRPGGPALNHEQVGANGLKASFAPFEQMHERQGLVSNFMALFLGRPDLFARQWADRQKKSAGYVPVRRPMTGEDVEDHFKGARTYGFYLMDTDSRVKCGVIDADLVPDLRHATLDAKAKSNIRKDRAYMAARISEASGPLGLFPVVEFSGGKGYHFWFFMESPVPAGLIRKALSGICDTLAPDLTCFSLEVFPKQDHLSGKGLGNLVKLPLGIHRLTGQRSFFPDCPGKAVDAQLRFLNTVARSKPDMIKTGADRVAEARLIMHPEMAALNEKIPELFELERKCPALGRLFVLVRERRTLAAREEKIIFQTLGFLPGAKRMVHYLMSGANGYNPHMVDYKLSRVRGTPLGCRRIHSLTGYDREYCRLEPDETGYLHPLIHLASWANVAKEGTRKSEKIENLSDAVENMKTALIQLEKFLK